MILATQALILWNGADALPPPPTATGTGGFVIGFGFGPTFAGGVMFALVSAIAPTLVRSMLVNTL